MLAKIGQSHVVNMASIQFIEEETPHPKTNQPRCKVTFTNGATLVVSDDLDRIEKLAGQIVPAPSDFYVIQACGGPTLGELGFMIDPVVAFRAMADSVLLPVLPSGEPTSTHGWALIYPDGHCEELWDRVYDSVDDFKVESLKLHRERLGLLQ